MLGRPRGDGAGPEEVFSLFGSMAGVSTTCGVGAAVFPIGVGAWNFRTWARCAAAPGFAAAGLFSLGRRLSRFISLLTGALFGAFCVICIGGAISGVTLWALKSSVCRTGEGGRDAR